MHASEAVSNEGLLLPVLLQLRLEASVVAGERDGDGHPGGNGDAVTAGGSEQELAGSAERCSVERWVSGTFCDFGARYATLRIDEHTLTYTLPPIPASRRRGG